jgi:hypothetical protein
VRAFGWREDAAPSKDALVLGTAEATPQSVHLLQLSDVYDAILDQGPTGACVAHAVASAVRLCMALRAGSPVAHAPLPSRRWIYRLARESHGEGHIDEGTYISSAIHVMQNLGWPTEERVRWNPSLVLTGMSAEERMHAYDQRYSIQEYAITAGVTAGSRMDAVRHALALRYPVIFGANVDQAFLDCRDWMPQRLSGRPLGGHAMVAIGYEEDGIVVLNSWGHDWGMGGIGMIAWDAPIRDTRAVQIVRRPSS